MSRRICKQCGNPIARKIPYSKKKTPQNRYLCYICLPVPKPYHNSSEHHKRKEQLVNILGGKCSVCGYNKSTVALSFHHRHPSEKKFDISHNGNMMKPWDELIEEVKKCQLLCLNCHAELDNTNEKSV